MKEMQELAEQAVEMMKNFNLELDYSAESLVPVEFLAQKVFKWHMKDPMPEEVLLKTANIYGAYLGEVLLRSGLKDLGFAWVENEEGEIGVGKPDFWMAPVTKVYKRITRGPEHSLVEFFECMFGMAVGAVGLDDPRLHILDAEAG